MRVWTNVIAAVIAVLIVLQGYPAAAKEIPVVKCSIAETNGVSVDCTKIKPLGKKAAVNMGQKELKSQAVLPRAMSCNRLSFSKKPQSQGLPERVKEIIERAATSLGLDPRLMEAVAQAESGGNQAAISPAGAIGVMQLMPGTARGLGVNPWDTEQNIWGGGIYLKQQLNRHQGNVPLALASYNAGPSAVEKHRGIPPYPETHKYIARVLNNLGRN